MVKIEDHECPNDALFLDTIGGTGKIYCAYCDEEVEVEKWEMAS
jgi:uncharacterized Zn finger protein (UPF0148 family)